MILGIAKSAVDDYHRYGVDNYALAMTLIIRIAERTVTPTEARDDWLRRG